MHFDRILDQKGSHAGKLNHLAMEQFKSAAGFDAVHAAYRGIGPAITDTLGRYDVKAKVEGGGLTGQAGALRLAVARALVKLDESHRKKLRDLALLTRDARAVERKKPGRPKARKKFQFSKR